MFRKWLRRNLDESARRWVQPVVIGLLGLVAYLPQCTYPFVYDDVFIIARNPTVCDGPWLDSLTKPYWPREFSTDPLYRPVTALSSRLDYAVFGDRAIGYRVTNAVLHGICAALVALLAGRLWGNAERGMRNAESAARGNVERGMRNAESRALAGRGPARGSGRSALLCAWVAGVLFAVHPIHADAVALVVGRTELLAALFALAVLYRHAGYLAGARTPSVRYHVVSAVLLLLAAGSKEHGVLTLPAVALLDLWHRCPTGVKGDRHRFPTGVQGDESGRHSGFRATANRLAKSHYLGMIFAVAVFLFARWLIFGGRTVLPADHVNPFANPLIRASGVGLVATPLALLFLTVRLFIVPVGLCPIWSVGGFDLPQTLWRADVVGGAALTIAGLVIVLLGLRRRWIASLLVALAGLFLLIPCHFVPAANWLFAERWVYLPTAFLTILVAAIADWPARRTLHKWSLLALLGVLAVALFAANWRYQQNWRSDEALADAVLARHPYSYQGLLMHVQQQHDRGQLVAAKPHIDRLIERFPNALLTWYYQTLLMDQLDRPSEVLEALDNYIHLSGPNPLPADLRAARNRARAMLSGKGALAP